MIRLARPGDEDAVFELVRQLGHAFPGARRLDATIASYFAGEQPTVVLQVAEEPEGVLGYVLTTVVPLLSTNGPSAQLQEIAVDRLPRIPSLLEP